jgi:Na+-transporting NADH:ubiquinone oxidoreductase subunit C
MALDKDMVVQGAFFDHKGETPGLGARITEANVQARFEGKSFYDPSQKIATIHFVKGEGNADLDNTSIDGLSGATMTTNGVSTMFGAYYKLYEPYLNSLKIN